MSCDVGEVTEILENEQSSRFSPTSQDFHLRHLASRPCCMLYLNSLLDQFTSKMGLHHTLPTLFAQS